MSNGIKKFSLAGQSPFTRVYGNHLTKYICLKCQKDKPVKGGKRLVPK